MTVILSAVCCALAHAAVAQVTAVAQVLVTKTPDILRLPVKQWQMHQGDDAQCAAGNGFGCSWTAIPDGSFRSNFRFNTWYRTSVELPESMRAAGELGLLVEGLQPVYEVYVSGEQVGASGSFVTRSGPQCARQIFRFPASVVVGGRVQIAIHSLGLVTATPVGGFLPVLGRPEQLEEFENIETLQYLAASWEHYLTWLITMCAALMFFLLYAVNTRLKEYFWLGAKLVTIPVLRIMEFATVASFGAPSWMGLAIYCVGNGLLVLFAIEFAFAFLGRPVPKIWRVVEITGFAAVPRLLLLLPLSQPTIDAMAGVLTGPAVHNVFIGSLALAALAALVLLPVCFRSRLPEMQWIGTATVALILVEFNRQLGNFSLPSVPEQFPVGRLELDVRPLVYLAFAVLMLVSMTFRFRRIQDRGRQIEQEVAAARTVQQILIPDVADRVEGLTIESVYLPAQELGGDFFQVVPVTGSGHGLAETNGLERPCAFVVLGDVSGKGLKAAMVVSLIVGALRSYAEFYASPGALLGGLNRRLAGRADGFTTCLALAIYPSGDVAIANAGHLDPYVGGVELETERNLPLGIVADAMYSDLRFRLKAHETLTLVTDGVVEAAGGETRELFGFARTLAVSGQAASEIAEAAKSFGAGAPQADDITVLTITRNR